MAETATTAQTMTPAEEMRAAATKLRETAKNAPRGPWEFVQDLYWDRDAIVSPEALGWDALVLDVHNDSEGPAARWAALAHPGLAEPLAEWLEHLAEILDETKDVHMRSNVQHALAVARIINGT